MRDAGFLTRDLLQRFAEHVGVVEADRRNRRHLRLQHVGPVEPSPQSDFDHRRIDTLGREVRERERQQRLVIGGTPVLARNPLDRRHHFIEKAGEALRGNRDAVDARAFGHTVEMRFRVQPRPLAGGRQHGGDHRARRPFAAGAADVNRRILPMRIAQLVQKGAHPVEVVRSAARDGFVDRSEQVPLGLVEA